MVPSLGLGDLQKGEKYCNVDYVLLRGVQPVWVKSVFFSYNIVCQWSVNLLERMQEMLDHLQIPKGVEIAFGIPKLHCPVHVKKCQFHYMNWCKFIGMGKSLAQKQMIAHHKLKHQTEVHYMFMTCLPDPQLAQKWTEEVTAWENNMDDETEAMLLHQLQEEERQEAAQGQPWLNKMGPVAFMGMALWIEDLQQHVWVTSEGKGELSNAEAVELHKKHVRLARRIKLFWKLQMIYILGACICMAKKNERVRERVDVEDEKLWPGFNRGEVATSAVPRHLGIDPQQPANDSSFSSVSRPQPQGTGANHLCSSNGAAPGSDFNVDVLLSVGEGRRVMSWIWLVEGGLGNSSDTDMIKGANLHVIGISYTDDSAAVRTEWLKSHAHILQWSEELQLVEEEMRWVQVSLARKVDWWEERRRGWQPLTPEFSEGIAAYVDKQVALIRWLVMSFSMLWGAQGDFDKDEWINEEDAESDVLVARFQEMHEFD
ncbi:hypothetical protein EV421DRAFT_1739936 [Armillaria borealis]|uniref:Uncharacterized protein n=1 Tax=Armillaria borealis TaxID=47425 RepID=A0AA39J4A5_9AGAR|nr:hypothetical protein EV421DRAFT_1739936 [Armillaria borealis]